RRTRPWPAARLPPQSGLDRHRCPSSPLPLPGDTYVNFLRLFVLFVALTLASSAGCRPTKVPPLSKANFTPPRADLNLPPVREIHVPQGTVRTIPSGPFGPTRQAGGATVFPGHHDPLSHLRPQSSVTSLMGPSVRPYGSFQGAGVLGGSALHHEPFGSFH